MGSDPLALRPEQMREMGRAVVEMLIARIDGLRDEPVLKTDTLEQMRQRLAAPPSTGPRDFGELLRVLDEDVLPFVGHFDHPRFFGYIPGAGTWPAALGDLIAAATMIDAGSWREAAGPSALELTVLDWFRGWVEYPESAAGVLVSGGSAANLTAIACAREALIGPMSARIVMYTGDQTHSSVARAARHLGFRPDQLRVLPTDNSFRLRPADVVAAIDADLAADRLPFLVSANAGTTNTGAVDPIGELADACHERGVWLHVDGAYGAFAVLTERGKRAMPGIERADSITLDPHKWLAMPFEVGCLLVREGRLLEHAFELHPDYLKEGHEAGVNFADRGLQLTRASRAIKVWLAIETFGLDAFRATIDRAIDQTLAAQARIEADARLELVTPASLGILTFRRRGIAGEPALVTDRRNEAIVQSLAASGEVLLTSTLIKGRYAIRLCVLNHTTEDADVAFAIDRVAEADVSALDLAATAPTRPPVAGTTVKSTASGSVRFRRRRSAWSSRPRGDHRRPGRSLPGRRPRGKLRIGRRRHGAMGARAHLLHRPGRRGRGDDRRDRGEPPRRRRFVRRDRRNRLGPRFQLRPNRDGHRDDPDAAPCRARRCPSGVDAGRAVRRRRDPPDRL